MSPKEFIDKWSSVTQTERATAQSHFNDLCDLLGEPKPHDADPTGETYAFEKGAAKTGGGDGWADVWRRGCFAWEYKGKHKDLEKALVQVKQYAAALHNPPLLVASDINRIIVITNWTNTVSVRHEIHLSELTDPFKLQFLKKVFQGDQSLCTGESRTALTAKVASEFAKLAQELQNEGYEPLRVAHFVNRLVFCMFAEDAGLLSDHVFSKMLDVTRAKPEDFVPLAGDLFRAMSKGGRHGFQTIDWFNGGLFEDDDALPLTRTQIDLVRNAATLDWSAIDPSILGTLFERGLDPEKRSQLGAHYTDPQNIMRIVNPVVLEPLSREWDIAKVQIETYKSPAKKKEALDKYLDRLRNVTVLDPACGSGNFLYLALRGLKDLEHRVLLEAESMGLQRQFPQLDPSVLRGIELNVYAAELARVSIWIGELQWQIEHGFNVERKPILKPLDSIENRDSLLNVDGTEAIWPAAEFIIGNPPFIGDKVMREHLGDSYTEEIRKKYKGHVPGGADFVCYWFAKGAIAIESGKSKSVGLVSTNKIRKGANSSVLRQALISNEIFAAWSDVPWHDEKGAAVRVAITCFAPSEDLTGLPRMLDGVQVAKILPDLTGQTTLNQVDLGLAGKLSENLGKSFNGICLSGDFDVTDDVALLWLLEPNPSNKPNSDLLRPLWNGKDLATRWAGRWLIDTGTEMSEEESSQYVSPFAWLEEKVKPVRTSNKRKARAEKWWRQGETRPGMRQAFPGS